MSGDPYEQDAVREALEEWLRELSALDDPAKVENWVRQVLWPLAEANPVKFYFALGNARPTCALSRDLAPEVLVRLAEVGLDQAWWVRRWPTVGPDRDRWYGGSCGCRERRCRREHHYDGRCPCLEPMIATVRLQALTVGTRVTLSDGTTGAVAAGPGMGSSRLVTVLVADHQMREVPAADLRPVVWPPDLD